MVQLQAICLHWQVNKRSHNRTCRPPHTSIRLKRFCGKLPADHSSPLGGQWWFWSAYQPIISRWTMSWDTMCSRKRCLAQYYWMSLNSSLVEFQQSWAIPLSMYPQPYIFRFLFVQAWKCKLQATQTSPSSQVRGCMGLESWSDVGLVHPCPRGYVFRHFTWKLNVRTSFRSHCQRCIDAASFGM